MRRHVPALAVALLAALAPPAAAHLEPPPALSGALVVERPGARVPLELEFADADGRPVRLADLLGGGRPALLVLAWYRCPMLCGLVLRHLAEGLSRLDWRLGREYGALAVSFDPGDRPYDAGRQRATALHLLGRAGDARAWPFLVGDRPAIAALADSVGFRYRYDAATRQFAHPAVVFVLTPEGRVSRYLYGIDYPPRDLKLALLEASEGKTGSSLDRVLLRCYRYDPATRRYGLFVSRFMQGGALVVLAALGSALLALWRRERRRPPA